MTVWRGIELRDTTRFEPIKEHRGDYLVEYNVPIENFQFAVLQLVFVQPRPLEDVALAMTTELEAWLKRYPVPIQVFAFDDTGQLTKVESVRGADYVLGWLGTDGRLVAHWGSVEPEQIPSAPFTFERLVAAYPDLPRKTSTAQDKAKSLEDTRRRNRALIYVLIVWFGAIPIAIALITQFVNWAGWIATGISVLNGLREIAKLKGWIKPSQRQRERDEEERRMKHHHYWCERNPAGFARLMSEAIDAEERERTRKEAEQLRNQIARSASTRSSPPVDNRASRDDADGVP